MSRGRAGRLRSWLQLFVVVLISCVASQPGRPQEPTIINGGGAQLGPPEETGGDSPVAFWIEPIAARIDDSRRPTFGELIGLELSAELEPTVAEVPDAMHVPLPYTSIPCTSPLEVVLPSKMAHLMLVRFAGTENKAPAWATAVGGIDTANPTISLEPTSNPVHAPSFLHVETHQTYLPPIRQVPVLAVEPMPRIVNVQAPLAYAMPNYAPPAPPRRVQPARTVVRRGPPTPVLDWFLLGSGGPSTPRW